MSKNRAAVSGCLLGRVVMVDACEDCMRCGWNPNVAAERKAQIRSGQIKERERIRLTAARKTAYPDADGWFSVRRALPDPGERVIVTDGVFVGEAYLGKGGTWKRYGADMVGRVTGIFPPVAWRPMPAFAKKT